MIRIRCGDEGMRLSFICAALEEQLAIQTWRMGEMPRRGGGVWSSAPAIEAGEKSGQT